MITRHHVDVNKSAAYTRLRKTYDTAFLVCYNVFVFWLEFGGVGAVLLRHGLSIQYLGESEYRALALVTS